MRLILEKIRVGFMVVMSSFSFFVVVVFSKVAAPPPSFWQRSRKCVRLCVRELVIMLHVPNTPQAAQPLHDFCSIGQ